MAFVLVNCLHNDKSHSLHSSDFKPTVVNHKIVVRSVVGG